MKKAEPNGKVVLYVKGRGGAKVDAEILIRSEIQVGALTPGFRSNTLKVPKDWEYLIVGMAKTTPATAKYELPSAPYIIDEALNYTQTKFFRLMLDLMTLAQFNPYDGSYAFESDRFHSINNNDGYNPIDYDINYSVSVAEIDAQLYRKYGFTQPMIDFVERRYGYDNGAKLG